MREAARRAVDAWFEAHSGELLEDVRRLIAVRSVREAPAPGMPYGPGPAAALEVAMGMLSAKGFSPFNFENRVVTADLNAHAPVLGILAHLDTVGVGDGWSSDPLEAAVRDGRLYGRGASDDKGPAVAALYALAAAKALAPELAKGCRLILGSAEETGHDDLSHYRKAHDMPPNVFTPDADYPVVNAEKGRYVPDFSAVWPESGALPRVLSLRGGATANAVPDRAEAVVEGLPVGRVSEYCAEFSKETLAVLEAEALDGAVKIISDGKAAHAAEAHEGINAQTALLSMLAALPLADSEALSCIRKLSGFFPHGDTSGEALGIAMSDEVSGPLTLNFGVLDVGPAGLTANFDCRTPKCATPETLDAVVARRLNEAGFKINKLTKTPFHYTSADTDFVRTLLKVYEEYTGQKGECLPMGGQTYVHDINGGVAFGCVFPGVDTRMHGADEFIPVDDLILSAKMFTQVILDMCS